MNASTTSAEPSQLKILYWPVSRLQPSARNARTHSKAQIAEIAASITAFGFTNPILVGCDGEVIAGHGRLTAARSLGLSVVPVIELGDLSEAQCRQLMLADNRIALNAGWDMELLAAELRDLSSIGADLTKLGFTAKELASALMPITSGLTDEDEVPAVADHPVSRSGDVWKLGDHRVVCGDSTDGDVVGTALADQGPNLMVTDPPYGVSYDPTWRHRSGVSNSQRTGKVSNDERADWREAWALFPGAIAYVWHGALHATTVAESLTKEGFAIRAQIIWGKERLVIGRGDYHWQHEPCWYAVRKTGNWVGDRKQTTLWSIPSRDQDTDTIHGTQKPVECMRRPILNHTMPGDAVYEPFLGSGTTLIAAQSTGRVCRAIELDPRYVDVAVRRWQAFAGGHATLASHGRTFDDIARERGVPADDVAGQAEAIDPSRPIHNSESTV